MRKQVRAFLHVKLSAVNVLIILAVLLPLSSANNTAISPISNTTFTSGPYGTISINPKTLSTPWPTGSGFLGFSFLLGLPGVLDARKNPTGTLSYKDFSFRKTTINSVFSVITILRCVVHSTAAILALRHPPPYPRLSDTLMPLGLTVMLYWERAADRRNILFLITLPLTLFLLGISTFYLGLIEILHPGRSTCLYTYLPSANCVSISLCEVLLTSNFSCADYPPTPSYVCSAGETIKGDIGMYGAAFVLLIAFTTAQQSYQVIKDDKTVIGERVGQLGFVFGIICGAASLGINYFGTAKSTSIQIGDCRSGRSWVGDCGTCAKMLSPNSSNGYLDVWWGERGSNWLDIISLS
jgi:hypothetical protein